MSRQRGWSDDGHVNILASLYAQCQLGRRACESDRKDGRSRRGCATRPLVPSDALTRVAAMRMRVGLVRMHDPSLRSPSAHHAAQEHRAAIARHAVVVPRHVAVNPAPHRSPSQEHNRPEAREMPHARALDLYENVSRIGMIHFRLAQQLPDQDTELARKVTVLKFAFTTDRQRRAARCWLVAAGYWWHSPRARSQKPEARSQKPEARS